MKKSNVSLYLSHVILALALIHQSFALTVPFMEDFAINNANWLNGASGNATWLPSGGVDGGGRISYTAPSFTTNSTGPFPGSPPFQLMFRANNSSSSSNGAFVGNWLSGGVTSLGIAVRHNYDSTLNFYARLAAAGGAGASLANDANYAVIPNTWTTISIPIVDSNPPFSSYGAPGSTFTSVFSNIQNLQFGLYLPVSTQFNSLQMEIDSVSIVPEPATAGLLVVGLLGLRLFTRRQWSCF